MTSSTGRRRVVAEAGQLLTDAVIQRIRKADIIRVRALATSGRAESMLVKNTLARIRRPAGPEDQCETIETPVTSTEGEELALRQIYVCCGPATRRRGDRPVGARALFFSPKRYDLGRVAVTRSTSLA